jgi:hypothetical protein
VGSCTSRSCWTCPPAASLGGACRHRCGPISPWTPLSRACGPGSATGRAGPVVAHHSDRGSQGGFNWSSQHLDHGGVQGWRRATGERRPAVRRRRFVGSGVLIGRCGRRCARPGGRSRRGWCSGSSGGRSRRASRRRRHRWRSGCRSRWGCVGFVTLAGCRRSAWTEPTGRYLTFEEREEIAILRAKDKGVREIARAIGRDPGTVSRANCAATPPPGAGSRSTALGGAVEGPAGREATEDGEAR